MEGDLRLPPSSGSWAPRHEYGLDMPPRPTVYVYLFQRPQRGDQRHDVSDADTRSVASAARGILQDLTLRFRRGTGRCRRCMCACGIVARFNVILIDSSESRRCCWLRPGYLASWPIRSAAARGEIGVRVAPPLSPPPAQPTGDV